MKLKMLETARAVTKVLEVREEILDSAKNDHSKRIEIWNKNEGKLGKKELPRGPGLPPSV